MLVLVMKWWAFALASNGVATMTIAANGERADATESCSRENYQLLKDKRCFSALVPAEYGGGGVDYAEMCEFLRQLATYHPSTALACSMHQHIVAANRYNAAHGRPGHLLLEKVAAKELVLISTGAGDWLASNGDMEKVEGGYRLNGSKHFASGSPVGEKPSSGISIVETLGQCASQRRVDTL